MTKRTELRYLVAIPIPYLDRRGGLLAEERRGEWIRLTHEKLHECFQGTLEFPAPGTNVVDGKVLYEEGQTLVVSLCADRKAFKKAEHAIEEFALRMGTALDQDCVLVLAFSADAQILEIPRGAAR